MNRTLHQRAQQLFAQSLVEGISSSDQSWLEAHLFECADCARETASIGQSIRALRAVSVSVPRDLAARTQMRLRLRAQESARRESSGALLWIVTAASWLLGILTAPFVWRIFAWAGSEFNLPRLVLQLGFVLWWTVPALIAVVVVLHHRSLGGARS